MNPSAKPGSRCECGIPLVLAQDENCPIAFQADLHEYQIVSPDSRWIYPLRYCPNCGGSLVASTRAELFAEMDSREVEDAFAKIREIEKASQVRSVLGAPEAELSAQGTGADAVFRYDSAWSTVSLLVMIEGDQVRFSLVPKPKSR